MKTLVVLPTFDEADNIAEVLRRLRKAVPAADVLVVDDSSPDSTAEIAKVFGAEPGGVDVLVRAGKWGLGSAYRDGLLVTRPPGSAPVRAAVAAGRPRSRPKSSRLSPAGATDIGRRSTRHRSGPTLEWRARTRRGGPGQKG